MDEDERSCWDAWTLALTEAQQATDHRNRVIAEGKSHRAREIAQLLYDMAHLRVRRLERQLLTHHPITM